MKTLQVNIGDSLTIGSGCPIAVQTMCNTHTYDEEGTVAQCVRMAEAGARLIRITVPGPADVGHMRNIHASLRSLGIGTPLCADIHFSSDTAIAVAPFVEKVRINPGNFHPDHGKARERFASFLDVCREYGTAVRIGLNHGSLGKYITDLYGITKGSYDPLLGTAEAARVMGEPEVFVIGGGGSGIPVYRQLQRQGIPFAAGVIPENDLDYPVA